MFTKLKERAKEVAEAARQCEVCHSADAEHSEYGSMLLCGQSPGGGARCLRGFHQRCLDPPLDDDDVPLGEFYCPEHARH